MQPHASVRSRTLAWLASALALTGACAGTGSRSGDVEHARAPASAEAGVAARSGATPALASAAPTPSAAQSAVVAPEPARAIETVHLLDFEQELEVEVFSIAIGKPRVAVLGDEPWVRQRDGWQKVPIPEPLRPAADQQQQVRIFFGRDDRPRIMGWRSDASGSGAQAVYLRHQHDGWHAERGEIGRLSGSPPGALFGVLGHDDPEVVCKVDDICIVKRRTGWQTIGAGPGPLRVELCGASAWALHADHLARVTDRGWERVAGDPPWKSPDGFWAIGEHDIWVAVAAESRIFHYDGKGWQSDPSPVPGPRSLWATAANAVWLVGDGGAAHFDGKSWRRVDGPTGPLREVRGASAEDVWIGGSSGLWHGTRG